MKIILFVSILILSACSSAQKSSEVNKAYVSSARYSGLSCESLMREAENIRSREPAIAAAVDKHYKGQKTTEVITWLLFWPAAFWLDDGSSEANRLSQVRGELDAIRQAISQKKC